MRSLAISYRGMEHITALEIKELLNLETEVKDNCVLFDANQEELAKLCYKGQAVNRVLHVLTEFNVNEIENLELDFAEYLDGKTFVVRSKVVDNKEINRMDLEQSVGIKIKGKVDFKNPEVTIYVFVVKDHCYFGVDYSGDISKRDYKIFTYRNDLKGTIAYALTRFSDYNKDKTLVNFFSGNATIAIEAALYGGNISVNHFNKDQFLFHKFLDIDLTKFDTEKKDVKVYAVDNQEGFIKSAQKNSVIADVNIKAEKLEMSEAFNKIENIDCIVIHVRFSKHSNPINLFKLLFEKAQNCKIVIASNSIDNIVKIAEEKGFKAEKREIKHGGETLKIAIFLKK